MIGVAAAVVSIGSCTGSNAPANAGESLVQHFTALLDKRDVDGAAELTSYPNAAKAEIQKLFDGMAPGTSDYHIAQFMDLDPTEAFFTIDAGWHFGAGEDWSYRVQGKARKLAVGWRISWDPEVLLPGLGHGHSVRHVKTYARPPHVLDIAGQPMLDQKTVNVVHLDPARTPNRDASADAVANAIVSVAPLITKDSLIHDLDGAHGQSITAVVLRDDDYAVLAPRLTAIPGVVVNPETELLSDDRRITSPIFGSLAQVWQEGQEATSGWAIQLVDSNGAVVSQLAGYQGPPGPDVKSTIDSRLQLAAENAAAEVGTAASIVAIQPSTGAVLAVAQNEYAESEGPVSLTGLYSVGDGLDLFAGGAAKSKKMRLQDVSTRDLMNTISSLGIGVDFDTPNVEEVTGVIPGTHLIEPIRLLAGGTGVQVSPFGMALAAATIARGVVPMPMVSFWRPATTSTSIPPLSKQTLARLRDMLRQSAARTEVVAGVPGLIGFTANAGDDQWFIGTRGDLAFAVHVARVDAADTAARLAAHTFA